MSSRRLTAEGYADHGARVDQWCTHALATSYSRDDAIDNESEISSIGAGTPDIPRARVVR